MNVVNKNDFHREFNSTQLKMFRDKEIKTWQWIVLFSCFFIQMFAYCVAQNLANVFVATDWSTWTGGNQTIMSLTFTIGAVGSSFFGPIVAKLFSKKINMRIIYSIGIFLAMLGFIGTGLNALLPQSILKNNKAVVPAILYISNLICQIGIMIFSGIGINNLISKWWPAEKRGFALGFAFAGGAAGNIWMQQLLGFLTSKFHNVFVKLDDYNADPQRLITYGIFAGMGLIVGLFFVMLACRKPVPPNIFETKELSSQAPLSIICVGCNNNVKKHAKNISEELDASFLVTRKYAPYWILSMGYLILQMGTIHSSLSTQFIRNALVPSLNPGVGEAQTLFSSISSLGLTIFGVACLIGNLLGGYLNQKMGPHRSIALAGSMQVLGILSLMLSVKFSALIYVYYILVGLSVYVYTSTPAYVAGRLYGQKQSNSHTAILWIFISLGFAVSNSVIGSITGTINDTNQTNLLGVTVNGNMLGFILFASICMAVGTLIVVICTSIILRKGIKGLLEYSPTKYTKIINWKYGFLIWWSSMLILLTGRDFRINNQKRAEKINLKNLADINYNSKAKFSENLNSIRNEYKLTNKEFDVLVQIYFNQIITLNKVKESFNNVDSVIKKLIDKQLVAEIQLNQNSKVLKLSDELISKLPELNIENNITKENKNIFNILKQIEKKTQQKIAKINKKLAKEQNQQINELKQEHLVEISNTKLMQIENKKQEIIKLEQNNTKELNEWQIYKKMYENIVEHHQAESLKNKLELEKQEKIKQLQTKIFIANFIMNFDKEKEIEGHNLLVEYYNDQYTHYDNLINKNIADNIQRKLDKINNKVDVQQHKLNKLLNKQSNIFSSNLKYLSNLEKQEINPLEIIKVANEHSDNKVDKELEIFNDIEDINPLQEVK